MYMYTCVHMHCKLLLLSPVSSMIAKNENVNALLCLLLISI